ncbi:MAG: 50S ribosomal protein L9 [Phycisphaerales bacterium]|jgi:large subunit ribosomal protein L9|nr:50S ribosomal protein L9 [Phycisphaerales bacterium]PHX78758.1 MAG: 50S ribosomal protein L9 [Planctomycetaceae bacterium]
MASKKIELLLNRTIENLGLVGDVVKVKPGFARNYLLTHGFAEAPTQEKIEALKDRRAQAQAELSKLRSEREALMARMEGAAIKLIRSVNDQGVLYGAVTQRDISDQLVVDGFMVDMRAVRLQNPIRRIGQYSCLIQLDRDLKTELTIDVLPDRALENFTAAAAAAEAAEEETPAADEPAAAAAEEPKKGKKSKKD